jgi:hypothetical protein
MDMTFAFSCGCEAIFVAIGFIVVVVDPGVVVDGLGVVVEEVVVDAFDFAGRCVFAFGCVGGFGVAFALVCGVGFVTECGAFAGEVVGLPCTPCPCALAGETASAEAMTTDVIVAEKRMDGDPPGSFGGNPRAAAPQTDSGKIRATERPLLTDLCAYYRADAAASTPAQ